MSEWIAMDDKIPRLNQPVEYIFDPWGDGGMVFSGFYLGTEDGLHGFGGKYGFSFGPEVQYWRPRFSSPESD